MKRIAHLYEKGDAERLARQLLSGEIDARCAAAVSLNRLGDARGKEWLTVALATGTMSARLAAAHSLALIGDQRGITFLIDEISDIRRPHFAAAYKYLESLKFPWLVPHIVPLLSHEDMTTRIIALRLLKNIDDPHGFLAAFSLPEARYLCLFDLQEEHNPHLTDYLAYALKHGNPDTRDFAARQLGLPGNTRAPNAEVTTKYTKHTNLGAYEAGALLKE